MSYQLPSWTLTDKALAIASKPIISEALSFKSIVPYALPFYALPFYALPFYALPFYALLFDA
jgi:hypothetical protein